MPVPCGKCVACLVNERALWSWRLAQEAKAASMARFLTLTYDDLHLPMVSKIVDKWVGEDHIVETRNNMTLVKQHLKSYMKRVRKEQPLIRYFAVGEYGTHTKRPHYHAIVFNTHEDILIDKWKDSNKNNIGHVHVMKSNEQAMLYVTKYLLSPENVEIKWLLKENGQQVPFRLMSKGMGRDYITDDIIKYHNENVSALTYMEGGIKQILPRYHKQKIFDKHKLEIVNGIANVVAEQTRKNVEYEDMISYRKHLKAKAKRSSKSN